MNESAIAERVARSMVAKSQIERDYNVGGGSLTLIWRLPLLSHANDKDTNRDFSEITTKYQTEAQALSLRLTGNAKRYRVLHQQPGIEAWRNWPTIVVEVQIDIDRMNKIPDDDSGELDFFMLTILKTWKRTGRVLK